MTLSSDIVHVGSVDSTMSVCRSLVATGDLHSGQAVLATHQSGGRGRADRAWLDVPETALLMTAFNDVPFDSDHMQMLSILAGLTLVDALQLYGVDIKLKWPNDLLVNDRKLAGILIVTTPAGDRHHVYTGFGVNVFEVPGPVMDRATCLALEWHTRVAIRDLAFAVLDKWNSELLAFADADPREIAHRWQQRAAWIGAQVTVLTDNENSGVLVGIDSSGRLRLDVGGNMQSFSTGDVTRGPRLLG